MTPNDLVHQYLPDLLPAPRNWRRDSEGVTLLHMFLGCLDGLLGDYRKQYSSNIFRPSCKLSRQLNAGSINLGWVSLTAFDD